MMLYGIRVVIVAPGSVRTPIWEKAGQEDVARFKGTAYERPIAKMMQIMPRIGRAGLPANVIGETVWRALTDPHPPQRVTRVAGLTGWAQIAMPPQVVDAAVASALELKPQR
jgi:NAD(P)-dependent dehydrogenase (short-subunit alcohol dehydrogenase family)